MKSWEKLKSVNCNSHVEKKGNLSYLSWAWAWCSLCDNYPDSTFHFEQTESGSEFWPMPDGSGEVRCSLTVDGITRTCWLPVMDYKNKAIPNPNSRDLNDTKMRCLVKAIALFGLGLYIYAGEDIPEPPVSGDPVKEGKIRQSTNNPIVDESDDGETRSPSVNAVQKWEEVMWKGKKKHKGKTLGFIIEKDPDYLVNTLKEHYETMAKEPDFLKSIEAAVASVQDDGKQGFPNAK